MVRKKQTTQSRTVENAQPVPANLSMLIGDDENDEEMEMEQALHQARNNMTLEERRGIRTDLGEGRTVMYTPPDDAEWHYHWANDEATSGQSRVAQMQRIGYNIVLQHELPAGFQEIAESKTGSDNVSVSGGLELHAGETAQGQPMKSVLMRIPQHLHQLDKQLREEKVRELESEITGRTEEEGMYGAIKLS